jgi:hypothetical protein
LALLDLKMGKQGKQKLLAPQGPAAGTALD